MRISKPAKKQQYLVFDNIADRDAAKKDFTNGQEIKVTDASGDANIETGWAIYKYDKENVSFDLLEKEEQSISIPKDFHAMRTLPHNWKLEEDFYFVPTYLGASFMLQPNHRRNYDKKFIPVYTSSGYKFMNMADCYVTSQTPTEDTIQYFVIYSTFQDAWTSDYGIVSVHQKDATDFMEVDENTLYNGRHVIAQLKVLKKADGTFDPSTAEIIEHWKLSIRTANYLDGITIAKDSHNFLHIPEHHNPLINGFLLEDFDYEVQKIEGKDSIKLQLMNNDGKLMKNIPVQTTDGIKYIGVGSPTIDLATTSGAEAGKIYRWTYGFKIAADKDATVNGWVTYGGDSFGFDARRREDPATATQFPLLVISLKVPRVTGNVKAEDFKIYKLWKNCLAPAEQRLSLEGTPPDGLTVEPVLDDKLRVIPAMENYSHIKIMQDFTMKAEYSSVVKQIKIYPDPNQHTDIPAKLYSNDRTFRIKNTAVSINVWANMIQGKTMYVAFYSSLVSDGSDKFSYKVGLGKFPDLSSLDPVNDVLLSVIKLPIPDDINNTDASKLVLHNIYKKALAPAEERINITPEIPVDKYTIDKNFQGQLSIPALQIGHKVNMFLLKDFDFNISAAGSDITIIPRVGNQAIPILVDGVRKYMRVAYWPLGTDLFGSNMAGKWAYWTVGATITDTETTSGGMTTYTQPSGAMVEFRPDDVISKARILTVLAYIPDTGQGESWDLSKIYMFKHWKDMLAPFDELWAEKVTP